MEVKKSAVTKILITEPKRAQAISVYLENSNNGWGKIIIEHEGNAWSITLNSREKSTAEFFCLLDDDRLVRLIEPNTKHERIDHESLLISVRGRVIKLRRKGMISANYARSIYDEEEWGESGLEYEPIDCPSHISETGFNLVFSDLAVPELPSYRYQHLVSIIKQVKKALEQEMQTEATIK